MKSFIVVTSIYPPTKAIKSFAQLHEHELIVVGDKKTPDSWKCENVHFLSTEQQSGLPYQLIKYLPFNHYCRKMLGYLKAMDQNAEVIIDTDDDNYPKANWSFPALENKYDCIEPNQGFVNIYQCYSDQHIWPRGLPLNLVKKDFQLDKLIKPKQCKVGIWQGLADEDPDVDAIYRITNDRPCRFQERSPVVLGKGTTCPFNSQNTLIRKELYPLLYLPISVTFRFTDILRGIVAQPVMWSCDYLLGFNEATVVQKRNPHDYLKDFESEVPMYLHGKRSFDIACETVSRSMNISDNLYQVYRALAKEKIVEEMELISLEAWLKDVSKHG